VEIKRAPGRPKATSADRQSQILKVATKLFATLGYEKTTIRLVADQAEVDPKLVMHYFGSKEALFAASMKIPAEATKALKLLKLVPRAQWGRSIAEIVTLKGKGFSNPTLVGIIRASATEPVAAEIIRDFFSKQMMQPMIETLGLEDAEIRARTLSSMMVGLTFTQEILGLDAPNKAAQLSQKKLLAQVIQTVLTADLS
jgi:AcrR family transcriptional regulator